MTSKARPLAAVLAGVALAVSASAALADQAKNPVQGVPAAAPAPGKGLPTAPALPAKLPKGYVQVHSLPFTSNQFTQTRGSVACPAGTVPYGGGVVVASSGLNANVNSSFPSGTSWIADVNNVGAPTTFAVYAVCGKAVRNYVVVESRDVLDPAETQATGTIGCPGNTVVWGGGALSNSGSTAVLINSTFPESNGWRTDMNTNTNFDTTFNVFAICAKKPKGYFVQVGAPVVNPPSSQTRALAFCPGGQTALGGGALSSSGSVTVDLNTAFPQGTFWDVFEDNGQPFTTETIRAVAICLNV
jgi:hypothetical protein